MKLRKYQQEAKQAVLSEWDNNGVKKTLLVLPTGTGKTIIFSSIAEECVRRGNRVLILAHREELLQQAADKIAKATGLACAVEKAELTAEDSFFRITVGSVQTLMREKRQCKFNSDYYGTIIVDEAHHCLADSYRKIFEYFNTAKVLGVTATPDRGDKRNLGAFFESLAYEYNLPTAIKEGFLCKIHAQTIPLNIDLREVGTQAGDYKTADLGDALSPYLEQIAKEMTIHCKGRKTLVFLPLIATSQKFCEILIKNGFRAGEVNCESKDRAQKLEDFAGGKYDILCNSMLLTEGYDNPAIDCIVCLRPTKIRSLYAQCVGRGTRIHPGKDNLLLLDFLWHTKTHELCRPAHLICEDEELANKVTQILAEDKNSGGMDLEQAMLTGESEVVAERERGLAKKLEELKKRKREFVDPIQFSYSIQAEDLITYEPVFGTESMPPTKGQLQALEKFGVCPDDIQSQGHASKLIDRLIKRREDGFSTPKQIRCLERFGFQHVGQWNFASAKSMIDRIAANCWHIPRGINEKTYNPEIKEKDHESFGRQTSYLECVAAN